MVNSKCEDVMEAIKPILKEEGLIMTITDNIIEIAGMAVVNATITVTDGTDSISVSAQAGIQTDQKGMSLPQTFGSASSYARKYAANGIFLIDDTKDDDATADGTQRDTFKPIPNPSQIAKMKEAVADGKSEAVEKALGKYNISDTLRKNILG